MATLPRRSQIPLSTATYRSPSWSVTESKSKSTFLHQSPRPKKATTPDRNVSAILSKNHVDSPFSDLISSLDSLPTGACESPTPGDVFFTCPRAPETTAKFGKNGETRDRLRRLPLTAITDTTQGSMMEGGSGDGSLDELTTDPVLSDQARVYQSFMRARSASSNYQSPLSPQSPPLVDTDHQRADSIFSNLSQYNPVTFLDSMDLTNRIGIGNNSRENVSATTPLPADGQEQHLESEGQDDTHNCLTTDSDSYVEIDLHDKQFILKRWALAVRKFMKVKSKEEMKGHDQHVGNDATLRGNPIDKSFAKKRSFYSLAKFSMDKPTWKKDNRIAPKDTNNTKTDKSDKKKGMQTKKDEKKNKNDKKGKPKKDAKVKKDGGKIEKQKNKNNAQNSQDSDTRGSKPRFSFFRNRKKNPRSRGSEPGVIGSVSGTDAPLVNSAHSAHSAKDSAVESSADTEGTARDSAFYSAEGSQGNTAGDLAQGNSAPMSTVHATLHGTARDTLGGNTIGSAQVQHDAPRDSIQEQSTNGDSIPMCATPENTLENSISDVEASQIPRENKYSTEVCSTTEPTHIPGQ